MIDIDNDPQKNDLISLELERAQIPVVYGKENYGDLFGIIFKREKTYWKVDGFLSKRIADEIYDDPVGRTDIRIGGHVLGLHPNEYGLWGIDKHGHLTKSSKAKEAIDFVTINGYHIDSEVGLRVFADIVKKHEKKVLELNEKH